jgi:glycine hydroxymethyltransferase
MQRVNKKVNKMKMLPTKYKLSNRSSNSILSIVNQLETSRNQQISLIASENRMSLKAMQAMASDATNRYILPKGDDKPEAIWDYPNQEIKLAIYDRACELANEIFGSRYAELRLLSGNNAAYCLMSSLTERGDNIFHVPDNCGGHFASEPICAREGIGLNDIPFDKQNGMIDIDALARLYKEKQPRFIFLDASMTLFPYPLSEIRDVVGEDAIIAYDASHVMGLIGGKHFQDPLNEGANILNGSTHKTLFGPQKGIILCRDIDDISTKIRDTVVPRFVSNAHLHHIAALGVAFEEILDYGRDYAAQVIRNAQTLAAYLDDNGVKVYSGKHGYTQSHQLWCILGDQQKAMAAFRALEDVGIFVNMISVPFTSQYGLRCGVAELTRRGFCEYEMIEVAKIFIDCVLGNMPSTQLKGQVTELSTAFPGMTFCDEEIK